MSEKIEMSDIYRLNAETALKAIVIFNAKEITKAQLKIVLEVAVGRPISPNEIDKIAGE